MSEASDINVKYQRLATEYSKMRAQVSVLKKAISEEQGKSNEFREIVKERDQTIRKLEQEVECLNFRNVQLMKRVSILQNDFEAISEKPSKNKHKAAPPSLDEDILNSELRSKIEENEKLYIQVTSAEIEHKRALEGLTAQLETEKEERLKETKTLNENVAKQKTTIDKLTKDRAKLELDLKHYEKEVKEIRLKEETCQEDLKSVETELQKRLECAEQIVHEKLPFIDTRSPCLNSANVPIYSYRQYCVYSVLLGEMNSLVSDFIKRLCGLHKNMESRIKLADHDILNNGLLKRFEFHLKDSTEYLKELEKEYQAFIKQLLEEQTLLIQGKNLNNVAAPLSKYVRYIEKLLPYILLSLHLESKIKGSIPRLEEVHSKLYDLVVQLTSSFGSIENCLRLFTVIDKTEQAVCQPVLVRRISQTLCNLQSWFEEIKKAFSAKVMLEQHLPTLTPEIKSSDSLVLTSMISVINAIKKISQKLTENMELFCDGIPCKSRGFLTTLHSNHGKFKCDPSISELRKRGCQYITNLHSKETGTIPQEIALKNNDSLLKQVNNENTFTHQLSTTLEKLQKMEQEKEHWVLEYQLLQMKCGKTNTNENTVNHEDIHSLFKAKKDQLLSELQIADSKAVAFHTENSFLHQKINLTKQEQQRLEAELADCQYSRGQLEDEMKTRITLFEDQLSTMSDHLAELNDKLTAKTEELEAIKYTANKKSRGK